MHLCCQVEEVRLDREESWVGVAKYISKLLRGDVFACVRIVFGPKGRKWPPTIELGKSHL